MTSVYGVTKYGARAQIDNQLRHNVENFPPHLVFDARAYLAEKTFECLYIMFTTNKAIQVCSLLFASCLLFCTFTSVVQLIVHHDSCLSSCCVKWDVALHAAHSCMQLVNEW